MSPRSDTGFHTRVLLCLVEMILYICCALLLQRHRAPDDDRPLPPPPGRGGALPGFVSAADKASLPAASQPVEGETEADRKKQEKWDKKVWLFGSSADRGGSGTRQWTASRPV